MKQFTSLTSLNKNELSQATLDLIKFISSTNWDLDKFSILDQIQIHVQNSKVSEEIKKCVTNIFLEGF